MTKNNKNNIFGVIAEYNPFHFGHKKQLSIIREELAADCIIVIMSGHFLQRGIPALMDKWTRARMAIEGGADLVVELPLRFSLASSDDFAEGALKLLSSMGVNKVCFGCEVDAFSNIKKYAEIIESNDTYDLSIRDYMSEGYSYVKANELALSTVLGLKTSIPPNALLGLSYMRAISRYDLDLEACPIIREGAGFHETSLKSLNPSAEGIRHSLSKHLIDWNSLRNAVPSDAYDLLYQYPKYTFESDFYHQIVSSIISLGKLGLREIRGVKEGLENRLYDAALKTINYQDLLSFITSKRYTSSSVRRIFFNALLGVKKFDKNDGMRELKYHRVLAMNKKGREYIATFRKNREVKAIVNFARDIKRFQLSEEDLLYDIKASAIYSTQCESIRANSDYLLKPFIVK